MAGNSFRDSPFLSGHHRPNRMEVVDEPEIRYDVIGSGGVLRYGARRIR